MFLSKKTHCSCKKKNHGWSKLSSVRVKKPRLESTIKCSCQKITVGVNYLMFLSKNYGWSKLSSVLVKKLRLELTIKCSCQQQKDGWSKLSSTAITVP